MDDDEVDAGQFEPIAQMRRLAIVLPKALELVDKIPVKLCLPESLDPDLFSELLRTEQVDSTSKHESVKKEKDLPTKVTTNKLDNHDTRELAERLQEKQELKQIELEKKELEKDDLERRVLDKKELERKEVENIAREKKEPEEREREKKDEKKSAREKKELEKKERERNAKKMKEHEDIETIKKGSVGREHEKKDDTSRSRKDYIPSKETSGKQNYWSESETSSVKSIDSQLSIHPGRNMRATPLSRSSSRNTTYDDLHFEVDPSETFSRRSKRMSPTDSSDRSYRHSQKRVRDKDLVDQLVEGRRREHRREVHRYYVKSMINDNYRRKRSGIASSSDLDHYPSLNRGGLPTPEPRSASTLSHRSVHSGHSYNEPKQHRQHHRSQRSDAAATHHHGDAGRRSADWVGSQQAGRRVQSAQPRVKGSDEADNVVMIIREEFKRLGFL